MKIKVSEGIQHTVGYPLSFLLTKSEFVQILGDHNTLRKYTPSLMLGMNLG